MKFNFRNQKITQIAMERREVDHAMSWLSTLGGAFSALGEEFQYCVISILMKYIKKY